MSRWLASGLRRDICVLLAGLGTPTGQALKRALEDHYGEHVSPSEFYGALDTLEDRGFVDSHPDGVHDRYGLTDAGRRSLERQFDWMKGLVEEDAESPDADDGADGESASAGDGSSSA
ncbi:MAG: PadR family transcriptional regulator [Halodesulfurarchaeum sp.]